MVDYYFYSFSINFKRISNPKINPSSKKYFFNIFIYQRTSFAKSILSNNF